MKALKIRGKEAADVPLDVIGSEFEMLALPRVNIFYNLTDNQITAMGVIQNSQARTVAHSIVWYDWFNLSLRGYFAE